MRQRHIMLLPTAVGAYGWDGAAWHIPDMRCKVKSIRLVPSQMAPQVDITLCSFNVNTDPAKSTAADAIALNGANNFRLEFDEPITGLPNIRPFYNGAAVAPAVGVQLEFETEV